MEAATTAPRDLAGEKAQRIIEAMRSGVARRGAAGATFDHVAREAGVSRGLLHYYFGTKERLLVEVVRRDCDVRMELLDASLARAHTAEDFVEALVRSLEDVVEHDPGFISLLFELFTLGRRNEEIRIEMAELLRRTRGHVADILRTKEEEGVLALADDPDAVATALFSLADGMAIRMLLEPERDFESSIRAGTTCARALLTGRL